MRRFKNKKMSGQMFGKKNIETKKKNTNEKIIDEREREPIKMIGRSIS